MRVVNKYISKTLVMLSVTSIIFVLSLQIVYPQDKREYPDGSILIRNENAGSARADRELYAVNSYADCNIIWQPDTLISSISEVSLFVDDILTTTNALHLFTRSASPGGGVFYQRSFDDGLTWEEPARLLPSLSTLSTADYSAVGDSIHMIWQDPLDPIELSTIKYKKSADLGETWQNETVLHQSKMARLPVIAAGETYIYGIFLDRVAFLTDSLFLTRSSDGGNSWSTPLPFPPSRTIRVRPKLAVVDSIIHLVWVDNLLTFGVDIHYIRSGDYGETWSEPHLLGINDSLLGQVPAMATGEDGSIYVVWMDYRFSTSAFTGDIFFRKSADGGVTWEDIQILTDIPDATHPEISVYGNVIDVVWEDEREGGDSEAEIFHIRSVDGGITWCQPVQLTEEINIRNYPYVFTDHDKVHVVWTDKRNSTKKEIFYRRGHFEPVSVHESPANLPLRTVLHQNYPNPFNPATTISFNLEKNGKVTLKVYNILGQVVDILIDGEMKEGEHKIVWEKQNTASGIYFYKLSANGKTKTRKMLLLK